MNPEAKHALNDCLATGYVTLYMWYHVKPYYSNELIAAFLKFDKDSRR